MDNFIPMPVPVENVESSVYTKISTLSGSKELTEEQISALRQQGYPKGLAESLGTNGTAFPIRIWVVDNSGSMTMNDGHRLIPTKEKSDVRLVSCTRWAEIQGTIQYHAQMAALLQTPTIFRLLNHPGPHIGPQQFSIADKGETMIPDDLETALRIMDKSTPTGVTPLTSHIVEIRGNIEAMLSSLQETGGKVAIVLATDGLPSDHMGYSNDTARTDFINALRSLEGLPVWIVIRLSTDEQKVVEFYSTLDDELELSVEVLDDFKSEAVEVHQHNPWINYALPLHRCREMGYYNRLLDLLDERPLNISEMDQFCRLLLGPSALDGAPEAAMDLNAFCNTLQHALQLEQPQWNPQFQRMTPWIDVHALRHSFGEHPGCNIL